jgi:hypothetical protein
MSLRAHFWTVMAAAAWLAGCGSSGSSSVTDGPADGPGGSAERPATDDGGATALAKFCNTLTAMGAPVEISVEVGDVAPVRLTAVTSSCSSKLGQKCQAIPSGMPKLSFFQGSQMVGMAQAAIMPGEELVLVAALNAANQAVIRLVRVSRNGLTCADFDVFAPPDGGAPGADAQIVDGASN